MFPDYQRLVVLDYQKKMAESIISPRLIHPTPAKLKAECKAVCDNRYDKKDESTLQVFFGQGSDKEACLKAIERCEIDRLRPLLNFLKDSTIKTDTKNVELLAWLLDFKRRPFKLGEKYNVPEVPVLRPEDSQKERNKEPLVPTVEPPDESSPPPNISRQFKTKSITLAILILVFLSTVIYFWGGRKNALNMASMEPTRSQACMYWTGDHYEQISCNKRLSNTLIIALDSEKLNHFRRITRTDTITEKSIGSVWYSKLNGIVEFYTSNGDHPTDPRLRLKPASLHMISKYGHQNQESAETSK